MNIKRNSDGDLINYLDLTLPSYETGRVYDSAQVLEMRVIAHITFVDTWAGKSAQLIEFTDPSRKMNYPMYITMYNDFGINELVKNADLIGARILKAYDKPFNKDLTDKARDIFCVDNFAKPTGGE